MFCDLVSPFGFAHSLAMDGDNTGYEREDEDYDDGDDDLVA